MSPHRTPGEVMPDGPATDDEISDAVLAYLKAPEYAQTLAESRTRPLAQAILFLVCQAFRAGVRWREGA